MSKKKSRIFLSTNLGCVMYQKGDLPWNRRSLPANILYSFSIAE
jgi:hypothetical protein